GTGFPLRRQLNRSTTLQLSTSTEWGRANSRHRCKEPWIHPARAPGHGSPDISPRIFRDRACLRLHPPTKRVPFRLPGSSLRPARYHFEQRRRERDRLLQQRGKSPELISGQETTKLSLYPTESPRWQLLLCAGAAEMHRTSRSYGAA